MQRGNGAESGGAGIREGRMAESGAELEGRWGAAAMEKGREWRGGGGGGKKFFKRGAKLLT